MRGSFWTRIRWGKAVAAAGVRGQDVRKKGKKSFFCHTGRFKPLKSLTNLSNLANGSARLAVGDAPKPRTC